jgi:tRNA (uracil-5-)-methyltransferase
LYCIGDSISLHTSPDSRKWAILAPFALPNELIRVRIDSNTRLHSKAVVLEILEKNDELRLKEDPKCKYFGKWSVLLSLTSLHP